MTIRNVSKARAQLSALPFLVENGEEVVITRFGRRVARVTKIEIAIEVLEEPRKLGALAGKGCIQPTRVNVLVTQPVP